MSTPRQPDDVVLLAERGQAFLQRARGLGGLSPHQIARIARRLEEPRPRGQRRIVVRAFAAAALVLTAGAGVAWATGALDRLPGLGTLFGRAKRPPLAAAVPRSLLEPAAASAPATVLALGAPPAASAGAMEENPDQSPSPTSSDEARGTPRHPTHRNQPAVPRPMTHRRASAAATRPEPAPAEPPESLIVLEGRSFARALESWRARRDVQAALAALDEHERRFAAGQMRAEALVLRAEILLAGRREREALAALDKVSLDRVPRGRELRTLRGELRVRFGRCEEGRSDLAPVARGTDAHAARAREALVRCP